MDPKIFNMPVQKRDTVDTSNYFGSLSTLQKREEVDAILEALSVNNPGDAAAVEQSLNKRQDVGTADEVAALLALDSTTPTNTADQKASLDSDVLKANGLNSDFTKSDDADTTQSQADMAASLANTMLQPLPDNAQGQPDTSQASSAASNSTTQLQTDPVSTELGADSTDSTDAAVDADSKEEKMKKRQVDDASAILEALAVNNPEDTQLAKAMVTSIVKRQGKSRPVLLNWKFEYIRLTTSSVSNYYHEHNHYECTSSSRC